MRCIHYTDTFTDSRMELFKKDIDALVYHMSNDIVNKQKLATDEIMNNIHNSVNIICCPIVSFFIESRAAALKKLRFYLPIPKRKQLWFLSSRTCVFATRCFARVISCSCG